MIAALDRYMPGCFTHTNPCGGLFVWGEFSEESGIDTQQAFMGACDDALALVAYLAVRIVLEYGQIILGADARYALAHLRRIGYTRSRSCQDTALRGRLRTMCALSREDSRR